MAFILADRVRETSSAPGTGTVTLLGAVTGYQTFSAGIGANNTTYYVIADQSGTNWEVGLGTIGAGGTTLARTTVLSSSNSGSLVNFSSGTQDVFCDYPAGKAVYKDASNNVTGYAISGGTIDNTPIGATTASTGAFTTLKASGNTLLAQSYDQGTGVLQVTGNSSFNGVVTDKSLNLQGGNNLVLNSATLVTQNITVTANTYTLSMTGTGTITLSGTSSGTLVGTGASTVVSKTFTPTAGTLTLTPTGSCTTVQLELGSVFSGYTATTGTAVTTTNNINVPSGSVTSNSYSINGGTGFYGSSTGAEVGSAGSYSFSSTTSGNGTPDIYLYRDAANTLAQRNSTNAQTFRLYNTYTDASNYERLSIDWSTTANTATIVTQNAGTGSARTLAIGQDLYINGIKAGRGGGNVSSNTVFGLQAINGSATGTLNSFFGFQTGYSLTSGNSNSGFGQYALFSITSGNNNTAMGYGCQYSTTTGNFNFSGGLNTLYNNTTGSNIVAVGYNALNFNTTASNLTAIGTQSLFSNTTNVATLGTVTGGSSYTNGTYTGVVMTLSSGSSAITYPTATIVVAGGVVTSVTITSAGVGFKDTTTVLTAPAASIGGTGSGFSVPVATLASGTQNTAVGYQAGYSNTTGTNNTFTGYKAGFANTTGNIDAFGNNALGLNTTGTGNAGFGFYALGANTTGNLNTAIGSGVFGAYAAALQANTTGSFNVAVGTGALQSTSTSNNSTAIGYYALFLSTGANNTAIGKQAGYGNASANANTTGANNTYLGFQTVGSANNNTNEMVIGYTAVGLGSNTTVIGNTSTTLTQTYGVTKSTNYTVATLPSASTSGVGARAFVTDALAPVFGSAVAGSGAVPIPVYSTGSAWNVG